MADEKKRHKSGAQKRREKKERESKQDSPLDISQNWLGQSGYRGTDEQWDPDAPPYELPLYGLPPATAARATEAILASLEQGQFYAASYQWDAMLRDERIQSGLQTRISGLFGQRLDLLPGRDDDQARNVKEDFEKKISKIFPVHQLSQLARNGLGLSVGVAQVLSWRGTKVRDASIRVWSNRFLRFDWMLRKYRLITENRGEITIEPGDPEWLVYEPFGPYGWLHGALLRPLMKPWLIRYWVRNWWARYQEVHGQPIRLGVVPAQRKPSEERLFLQQLSNLAHEAVIRLPQGSEKDGNRFDVKMLEASANSWQGFQELLKHCDESISIAILGQHQSTDGQGGLGSQEKAGESTLVRVLRQDALVSDVLREQVLIPLAMDNYGDPELAPYLDWDVEPPEDREANSKALKTLAEAVNIFATVPDFAKHVDIRALLEENDIPLVAEDQVPSDIPGSVDPLPIDEETDLEPVEVAPEKSPADAPADEKP